MFIVNDYHVSFFTGNVEVFLEISLKIQHSFTVPLSFGFIFSNISMY